MGKLYRTSKVDTDLANYARSGELRLIVPDPKHFRKYSILCLKLQLTDVFNNCLALPVQGIVLIPKKKILTQIEY